MELPAALSIPPIIPAMSCRSSHICGLFNALVIKSAICWFVFTYSMRTRGFQQTPKSHCTSARWGRGKCLKAMDLAFLTILMKASLSSAMTRTVVRSAFCVSAKSLPGPKSQL